MQAEHKVRIVPVPFWVMQYINDATYFLEDKILKTGKVNKARDNKVYFSESSFVASPENFSACEFLSIQGLLNVSLKQRGNLVNYCNNNNQCVFGRLY